ncbi:Metallo-dependent hydrolase [Testicularia cyperi]|uniref:Metallo-dependent hydrolase n=1 Tax=Testicularia cyperi TaxID=1882483 RepID=A0A317XRF2_9BASI|nr:Metallo-dependent hydrolase [Testicularia cyperi]
MTPPLDIDTYHKTVEALKAKEREQRYDHAALTSMSADVARANAVFDHIKRTEVAQIWEQDGDLDRFAGMDFHGARDHALGHRATDVWNIIQRMPKGAALHCHFDGTVDTRFLLEKARSTPNMAMKSSVPLTAQSTLFKATVEFLVLPESRPRSDVSIYSQQYVPDTWVSFETARTTFPFAHPYLSEKHESEDKLPHYLFPASSSNPAEAGLSFDAWIHSLMTLTPHPGVPEIKNSKQAWAKFQSTFGVIAGLLGYEPTLRAYAKELVLSHARDGISYTEARINFLDEFMVRADGTHDLSHEEWVRTFTEAVGEAKAELGDDCPVDARIIYTTVRFIDNDRLRWYLEDCIALKKKFPEWIVGFDLVGHEDPLLPLSYYIPELLRFRARCMEEGLDIPFVFHAGETLEDGGDADLNLYDAIALETKRIGHGVSLARHPSLTDIVKRHDICIEICPISNQVLGYTSSIAAHPSLLALLNQNVPVALSNDDASIFENFGLSYDFYQLAVSSKSTSLVSLATLARTSLRHSLVDQNTKQILLCDFENRWSRFIAWFLAEYGDRLRQ